MQTLARRFIKGCFSAAGYELKRKKRASADCDRLLEDPRDAFVEPNTLYPYLFKADLELAVERHVFGLGSNAWHPFVHALKVSHGDRVRLRKALKTYYDSFRPANAKEAIVGFEHSPELFRELPPYLVLTPWSTATPETGRIKEMRTVERNNAEHGRPTRRPASESNDTGPSGTMMAAGPEPTRWPRIRAGHDNRARSLVAGPPQPEPICAFLPLKGCIRLGRGIAKIKMPG